MNWPYRTNWTNRSYKSYSLTSPNSPNSPKSKIQEPPLSRGLAQQEVLKTSAAVAPDSLSATLRRLQEHGLAPGRNCAMVKVISKPITQLSLPSTGLAVGFGSRVTLSWSNDLLFTPKLRFPRSRLSSGLDVALQPINKDAPNSQKVPKFPSFLQNKCFVLSETSNLSYFETKMGASNE